MSGYISSLTEFRTYESPYFNKIYLKNANKTVCIIHIDKDWNMFGEILDTSDLPIGFAENIPKQLNQHQCERIIMKHMAPLCREKQLKEKYHMEKVDYAQIMYKTRLISLTDPYWVAWSEDEKVEDYHPRFNGELN